MRKASNKDISSVIHSLCNTPQVKKWPRVAVELVDGVTGGDGCLHRYPHLLPVRHHSAPALLHSPGPADQGPPLHLGHVQRWSATTCIDGSAKVSLSLMKIFCQYTCHIDLSRVALFHSQVIALHSHLSWLRLLGTSKQQRVVCFVI